MSVHVWEIDSISLDELVGEVYKEISSVHLAFQYKLL